MQTSSKETHSKEKKVAVVIPLLHTQPDADEALVLTYYLRLYSSYPIVFVAHTQTDIDFYQKAVEQQKHSQCHFERFEWTDYQSFNHLLTSPGFYARFLAYDYILMAHLDSFAFTADLQKWCALNYDYIGAVAYHKIFVKEYIQSSRLLRGLQKLGLLRKHPLQRGGFSLRKVSSFYRNSRRFAFLVKHSSILYTEDLFWSLRLPILNPFFRVAPTLIARKFAIELPDSRSTDFDPFVSRLHSLPMGCHGWKKFGYTFWKAPLETFMNRSLADVAE
jgi:hypothetical protein